MKAIRLLVFMAVIVAVVNVWPSSLYAIPVFARKYGFNCTMCHSNFPRLNDYGVRYRLNGYQLPGREIDDKTVFETPTPIAMRTSITYNSDKFINAPGSIDVSQFQLNALDILSGGLLTQNLGYFFVYPPKIEGSRGVVAQPGILEMANIAWINPKTSWLNIRYGRFEPGYIAFSAKRMLTFSPYEIYNFATLSGSDGTGMAFSDTRTGIELFGYDRHGFGYTAGLTNGSDQNRDNDSPTDMYIRVYKVFGIGEGQTTGQRIGLVGYKGEARSLGMDSRRNLERFGVDASLNIEHFNLALQYLHGTDDKDFWITSSNFKFSGGFAELSYLPSTDLVGFVRWDWVNLPSSFNQDISRWTIGGRYYLADNAAIHLEYSNRKQNAELSSVPDYKEDFFATGIDFAF